MFMLKHLIVIANECCDPKSLKYVLGRGALEYEKFLENKDPEFAWKPLEDEWHSIAYAFDNCAAETIHFLQKRTHLAEVSDKEGGS